MHPLRVGRVQEFDQPGQAPRRRLERERAAQRLIQIGTLARTGAPTAPGDAPAVAARS